MREWDNKKAPKISGQEALSIFTYDDGKGTPKLFVYDADGKISLRIDKGDHGYPSKHIFHDEKGNTTSTHFHDAVWKDGKVSFSGGKDINDALRKDFIGFLK